MFEHKLVEKWQNLQKFCFDKIIMIKNNKNNLVEFYHKISDYFWN